MKSNDVFIVVAHAFETGNLHRASMNGRLARLDIYGSHSYVSFPRSKSCNCNQCSNICIQQGWSVTMLYCRAFVIHACHTRILGFLILGAGQKLSSSLSISKYWYFKYHLHSKSEPHPWTVSCFLKIYMRRRVEDKGKPTFIAEPAKFHTILVILYFTLAHNMPSVVVQKVHG